MLKFIELKRYLLFGVAVVLAAVLICVAFAFFNKGIGSVLSAVLTGSLSGPLELFMICIFAHRRLFSVWSNIVGWVVVFVACFLGHLIFNLGDRNKPYRNAIFSLVWFAFYFVCFREHKYSYQLENKEEYLFCEECQKAHSKTKQHDCDLTQNKTKAHSKRSSNLFFWAFITLVPALFLVRMFSEIWQAVNFAVAMLIAAFVIVIVFIVTRDNCVQYDIPSLLLYGFVIISVPGSFYTIYKLGETFGVNIASIILTIWSMFTSFLFERFSSGITTSEDTLLFLFPHFFAVDLTQALFFLSDTVALGSFQFWVLLVLQGLHSVILNTGLKHLFIHKTLEFVDKAKPEDDPFLHPSKLTLIFARANLDVLSEQLSMLVIFVASIVGAGTRYLGATVVCPWCVSDPVSAAPIFAVVIIVRLVTSVIERTILNYFVRKWSRSNTASSGSFYVSKARDEASSLILLTTLSIGILCQVLTNTE